jgi:integrase|tara:strand:- start:10566 stop:11453 length:888 start_codon:yes stop_codon:yes gene_type:complete
MANRKKTLRYVAQAFFVSPEFYRTKEGTQHDYRRFITVMLDDVGDIPLADIRNIHAKDAYEKWLVRGRHMANHIVTAATRLWNYGLSEELMERSNPFASITRVSTKPRKVVWTKDQVTTFLEHAYQKFEYRNVGLIVQMSYEWGQRLGDMRLLTWDAIALDQGRVDIEQSKRGASVHLPISEDLTLMLLQQKEDFDFQKWVVPKVVPEGGEYHPYSLKSLSYIGRRIIQSAGLPDKLRMMDLRRTATTEMVEAGVSLPQIMAVTGHSNPQSLMPYMKNTFKSACSALQARKNGDT